MRHTRCALVTGVRTCALPIFSVTAMTGEALTATGISNVEGLQFFVPGVSITNDSMAIINIRGIGTSAFGVATDPSTTVHYDGVYISRPTTSYQDFFDVERIEVLRGPQGVLFGRNSAGGTLNIISKMPTEDLTGALGRSEEHTSELQSLMRISYSVFGLK